MGISGQSLVLLSSNRLLLHVELTHLVGIVYHSITKGLSYLQLANEAVRSSVAFILEKATVTDSHCTSK